MRRADGRNTDCAHSDRYQLCLHPKGHVSSPTGAPVSLFEAPPRTKAIAVQELRCPLVHGSFKWGITGAVWNQRSLGPAQCWSKRSSCRAATFLRVKRIDVRQLQLALLLRSDLVSSVLSVSPTIPEKCTGYVKIWMIIACNTFGSVDSYAWVSLVGQIHNGRKPTENLGIETTVVLYHCNSAQAQAGKRIWKQSRKWK